MGRPAQHPCNRAQRRKWSDANRTVVAPSIGDYRISPRERYAAQSTKDDEAVFPQLSEIAVTIP